MHSTWREIVVKPNRKQMTLEQKVALVEDLWNDIYRSNTRLAPDDDEKQFVEVVRNSITDGQICDWVSKNVKKPDSAKSQHREHMMNYPRKDDADGQSRLKLRKEQSGLSHRDDIQCFVDYIDADEKRI
jgi:hypothetical protein